MYKVVVIKGTKGHDITKLVAKVEWGGRKGAAPRNLKITMLDDTAEKGRRIKFDCEKGYHCIFYVDGKEKFRGIIVDQGEDQSKKMTFTAYDNLFYLANNKDSFTFKKKRADQIFKGVLKRAGLKGSAVNTKHVIKKLTTSKTTFFDTIMQAISKTYKKTGERFYVYSEKGVIYLKRRKERTLQWVLEVGENITAYSYSKSISNVKTRIKLLSSKEAVVAKAVNKSLEKQIGILGDVQSVDKGTKKSQAKKEATTLLSEACIPKKSLSVTGIGITEAISGCCVFIIIPHLGIKRAFFIDEDSHTWEGNKHTMKLTLNYAKDIDSIEES